MCTVGGYETAGTRCDIQKASANVSIDEMIWYGLRVQRRVCSSSSCVWRLVKNWHWWIRCATVSPIGPPGHGLVLKKLCDQEECRRIYMNPSAVSEGIRLCSTRWCITMNGLYYLAKLYQIKRSFDVKWWFERMIWSCELGKDWGEVLLILSLNSSESPEKNTEYFTLVSQGSILDSKREFSGCNLQALSLRTVSETAVSTYIWTHSIFYSPATAEDAVRVA
jgi:hypothetical protein